MQMRGQLDFEDQKKYAEVNAIVLYLFEKSDHIKHRRWEETEKKYVDYRKRMYIVQRV